MANLWVKNPLPTRSSLVRCLWSVKTLKDFPLQHSLESLWCFHNGKEFNFGQNIFLHFGKFPTEKRHLLQAVLLYFGYVYKFTKNILLSIEI
jgi:hypothetical protein